jgi:hypothetical protein
VPDAQACQVLVEQGAATTESDDADLQPPQDLLAHIAEQASMAIVHGIGLPRTIGRTWVEMSDPRADYGQVLEGETAAVGPQISGDGVRSEDERAHGTAPRDVQQRRVASLMGGDVI